MSETRSTPCSACPYRRDVPPGIWSAADYAKLPPYDAPTFGQPMGEFGCHTTPEHNCNGWAVVGTHKAPHGSDLLALRLYGTGPVPEESVPLFDSHTEAAEHGLSDVTEATLEAQDRLLRKYERLRKPEIPTERSHR